MDTWLDTQPTVTVQLALDASLSGDDGPGCRFALWLELLDLHLDQLSTERSLLDWDWPDACAKGWSPRTAAFAAWAKRLGTVTVIAGQRAQ